MPLAKSSSSSEAGFSLAEVAVATGILATVSLGVAQMFALSTAKNLAARHQVSTTAMATQKMEQMRGLTFSYDPNGTGLPVTDTTTNLASCAPATNGTGLNPSPNPGTIRLEPLESNQTGFFDFLDAAGTCVGTGSTVPSATVYVRRWSIVPLPTNPNNALVLTVLVTPWGKESRRPPSTTDRRTRFPEDSMLVTMLTRKAP